MYKECPMSTNSSAAKRIHYALAASFIFAISGTANAQDALGDGTALDANTGSGGRTNFTRPSFTDELSFRNAIATGNAPGGLSFRGDLGYRAAGEFSGDLGSDSLFAFRRDSLYSGLAGMGIRGTDALQYQFALTTGSAPPKNLMGSMSVARDGDYSNNYSNRFSNSFSNSTTARNRLNGQNSTLSYNEEITDLVDINGRRLSMSAGAGAAAGARFESGSMLGTLRSSSTYATTSNLQPALLSVYTEGVDRRPVGLIASPLLGIISTPMIQDHPKEANPLVARPTDLNMATGVQSSRLVSSYDGLIEQMRQHAQELRERSEANGADSKLQQSSSNDEWLLKQMFDLREKLYGNKPANENDPNVDPSSDPSVDSNTDPNSNDPSDPQTPNLTDPMNMVPDNSESPISKAIEDSLKGLDKGITPFEMYDPTQIAIDPDTLEILRGSAAQEIEQFYDPGAQSRDIYAEHITTGQRLIKAGRYFDAEERFTHALSVKPEDIPSQLGRMHAQIGAGMVLSASVNLQSLFSGHPEVVASKYAGNLLPTPDRIELLIARLKERSGITRPKLTSRVMESDRVRVSSALLLAYLGYQVEDQQIILDALAVVNERGSDSDRRFASLLAQIWIDPSPASTTLDGQE